MDLNYWGQEDVRGPKMNIQLWRISLHSKQLKSRVGKAGSYLFSIKMINMLEIKVEQTNWHHTDELMLSEAY